ncbi:hypothetical protein HMPREF1870_02513 [Bacteroidales bacterium KA00344]|nr:hypothetical protein HMPREF1870_02513 [Bacteroidales bacterium KA00344]
MRICPLQLFTGDLPSNTSVGNYFCEPQRGFENRPIAYPEYCMNFKEVVPRVRQFVLKISI